LFYGDYLGGFPVRLARAALNCVRSSGRAHGALPTREQFERWWTGIEAREVKIGWHNKNSWRGLRASEKFFRGDICVVEDQ
jgi:hypothetical protein